MKKKKLLILTSAALSAAFLTSCSSGSSTNFSANWYANTAINTVIEGTKETLSYSISMKEEPTSSTFAVYYTKGSYTTTLTSVKENDELVYSYQTEMTISVQFAVNGEYSDEVFTDSVTSTVLFKNTQTGLQPIRSEKYVESHSPASMAPSSLATAYNHYKYSVVTEYKDNCTNGTSVFTDLKTEGGAQTSTDFSISDKYSYIDNEELAFAIRGISLTASQQLQVYNASTKAVQVVKITPSEAASDLFSFTMNGTELSNRAIDYYPVSIAISAVNPGATQTAWYAKTVDTAANTYRNVLLRLETPLSYNLGTLVYELESADFATA